VSRVLQARGRGASTIQLVAGGLFGIVATSVLIASGIVAVQPAASPEAGSLPVQGCFGSGSILAIARPNDQMWVTARSSDGKWYQVFLPNPVDQHGWVDAASVQLLADGSQLPIAGCEASASSIAVAGSPTPGTPSATATAAATLVAIDACQVVTRADAEALARTALNPGQPGNPVEPSCTYTGPVTGPVAQVQVFIGDGAKKTLDIDRALRHHFTRVTGIADEAVEEANAIFLRKGTLWVALELVRLNDPAANRLPLEKLARLVATRLP
jgi:hypothetical protein